jgi:hypothetical protein
VAWWNTVVPVDDRLLRWVDLYVVPRRHAHRCVRGATNCAVHTAPHGSLWER